MYLYEEKYAVSRHRTELYPVLLRSIQIESGGEKRKEERLRGGGAGS